MLKITNYDGFKPLGKQKNKNKIILINTFRDIKSYLVSLKYRHNGEYDKIPNYVITKKGEVLCLLKCGSYSMKIARLFLQFPIVKDEELV